MRGRLSILLSFLIFSLFITIQADGGVLKVPDQYSTISEAVKASVAGDIIEVGPGVYNERIQLNPSTTLIGSGMDFTTLTAENYGHCIVIAENCHIKNLKIYNGDIAVFAKNIEGATVENCHIETRMHGIWCENSSIEILNNYFYCTYAAVKLISSYDISILNNNIEGRYLGIWNENSSNISIKRNQIKGFLVNILGKNTSLYISNNSIINSLYAGIALIDNSDAQIINNTISGGRYYGICLMNSEPLLVNNIIAYNNIGIDGENGTSPDSSYNIVSPNYTSNFMGYEGSRADFLTPALLVGGGENSEISEHILINENAHWKTGALEGHIIVPSVIGDKFVYNGPDREFFIVSNTETSITVFEEYRSSWLYSSPSGMLSSNLTKQGDPYFIDVIDCQTVKEGWDENSPAIDKGNPDTVYNDIDGSVNDIGALGGPDSGWIGYTRSPKIKTMIGNDKFLTGDHLHIITFIENKSEIAKKADIYKVLQYDDQDKIKLLFFGKDNQISELPLFERRTLTESYKKVDDIVDLVLSGKLPSMQYKIHSALMEPGTLNPLCSISTVGFFLTNKPHAEFTVTPKTGKKMVTVFYFDATGSYDEEDVKAVLQVRWKWEEDLPFTNWRPQKKVQRKFVSSGEKEIFLEVIDTDGNISSTSQTITVTD